MMGASRAQLGDRPCVPYVGRCVCLLHLRVRCVSTHAYHSTRQALIDHAQRGEKRESLARQSERG